MTPESKENKGIFKSKIRIEVFRHDQRDKTIKVPDEKSRLTKGGSIHAKEIGKTKNPNPRVGLAYGSPRERSQETALRALMANEDWVTEDMTMEEILKGIEERGGRGKKIIASEKLNYKGDVHPEYAKLYDYHFFKACDAIPFLYNESDDLVRKLGDNEDFCYTRQAANVADFVKKYLGVLPHWEKLTEEKPEKYKEIDEMQRFLGTHGSVTECFLLKIIEKTEGKDEAKRFIDSLSNKNGIDFSDGISIDLGYEGEEVKVKISFHDKTWDVDEAMIDNIIEDKTRLDEETEVKRKELEEGLKNNKKV